MLDRLAVSYSVVERVGKLTERWTDFALKGGKLH
jgi:hypothetical protein